jgi:hypothetical protein
MRALSGWRCSNDKAVSVAFVLFGHRNSDDLVPCPKGKITSSAILVGGEAVTAELQMTVGSTMGRKKTLGMGR